MAQEAIGKLVRYCGSIASSKFWDEGIDPSYKLFRNRYFG